MMMPLTWQCVRCGEEWPYVPDEGAPMPLAKEIKTDPKTGRRYHDGDVCEGCYNKPKIDAPLKSVALQRLVDEVRVEKDGGIPSTGYNRTYSRHNR